MDDLISRQKAIEAVSEACSEWRGIFGRCEDALKALPSAQPEIIRCKDCLHWVRTCGDNHWGLGDCDVFDKHLVMCEGYCAWAERRERRMNQKHCRGCPHLDFNEMSDEMYCKLGDYEPIRLRWHKHRPDWCPLVVGEERREK